MKTMKIALIWLVLVLINFALALLSLQIRDVWSLSSLVWFPGGIILGIVCVLPPRKWPLWLVTGLFIHLIVSQWYNRPVSVSLIFAASDVVTFIVSALVWQFFYGVNYAPLRAYDVIGLTLLCVIGGIFERFLEKWTLYLFNYPVDLSISFPIVTGYVMSYLPLTFFVIYLITLGRYPIRKEHCWGVLLAGVIMVVLFSQSVMAMDEKVLLLGGACFSISVPLLLVVQGEMRLLSGFLSFCVVGIIGASIFDYGPFPVLSHSRLESVKMASWYSVVLGFPALLIAIRWRLMTQALSQGKACCSLLNAVMEPEIVNRFMLDSRGRIEWCRSTVWLSCGRAPVSWAQLMVWVHQGDRQGLTALKEATVENAQMPHMMHLRIADGDGGYHYIRMALIAHKLDDGKFIEGIMYDITQRK